MFKGQARRCRAQVYSMCLFKKPVVKPVFYLYSKSLLGPENSMCPHFISSLELPLRLETILEGCNHQLDALRPGVGAHHTYPEDLQSQEAATTAASCDEACMTCL